MPPMDPAWLQLPERFTPARVTTSKSLPPDTPVTLAQLEGPGCIRRIFAATVRRPTPAHQRQIILRMFWDGADTPAVEAPLGDFFGQLHGLPPYALDSRYLTTQFHAGYTATFPMPFQHGARIEVEAGPGVEDAGIVMQIDWHAYPSESPPTPLRFHAQFRREYPLRGLRAELPAARRRRPRPLPGLQLRRGGARRPRALVARGRRERLCDERRRRPGGTLRPSARRGRRGHVWRLLRRRAAPTVHASRPGRALLRPGRHRPGPRPAHAGRLSVLRGRRHPLRAVDPGAIRVDGKRHLQHGLLVPGTAPPAVRPDAGVGPTPAGRGAAVRRHGRAGTRAPVAAAGSVPS